MRESEIALKATEEELWEKYHIVVTKVDELEIEWEQEEDRQREYRRNFPHTCIRCVLDDDDKFIKSKSTAAEDVKSTAAEDDKPKSKSESDKSEVAARAPENSPPETTLF